MGLGYLKVILYAGHTALHIIDDFVLIRNSEGKVIYELRTNEHGTTATVPFSAPDRQYSRIPFTAMPRFSTVDVETSTLQGYKKVIIRGVQIFDTITSILSIQLHPLLSTDSPELDIEQYFMPAEHGVDQRRHTQTSNLASFSMLSFQDNPIILANDVPMPEYITVHLGTPNDYAANVTVPFIEYIKNVASSEIFPTWDEAALYANIYAHISFTLNRMFTLWYRSRNFDFDITSKIAFDQSFVEGRCVFDNINRIVDEIFNKFLRLPNHQEPFISSYCNGTTITCDGLSQWGSQSLAEQGYTAFDILRYYYPSDILIVESNNFGDNAFIYPGFALQEGSSGDSVRLMQLCLNRIHGNYPSIPISLPDGTFGPDTGESVIAFQTAFNLIPDGIIGKSTWYAIVKTYVSVTNLAELTSEGIRIGIGVIPPTTTIQEGSSGELVLKLQFLLDYIGEFYYAIPRVVQTGRFAEITLSAVIEFQKYFGLTVDGVVGPLMWDRLFSVFHALQRTVHVPLARR